MGTVFAYTDGNGDGVFTPGKPGVAPDRIVAKSVERIVYLDGTLPTGFVPLIGPVATPLPRGFSIIKYQGPTLPVHGPPSFPYSPTPAQVLPPSQDIELVFPGNAHEAVDSEWLGCEELEMTYLDAGPRQPSDRLVCGVRFGGIGDHYSYQRDRVLDACTVESRPAAPVWLQTSLGPTTGPVRSPRE